MYKKVEKTNHVSANSVSQEKDKGKIKSDSDETSLVKHVQNKKSIIDNRPLFIRQLKTITKINNYFRNSNNKNIKVAQLVKAYRIGTSASKYKITVSGSSITEFKGGSSGIDISFGDETHAQYYFKTKSNDTEAEMVSWDFPDDFYQMILHRMKKAEKGKNWDQLKMWKAIWNKPAPVNSSDSIVNKGNLIAPHFGLDWIDPLNKYGKGSNAQVTTYDEFFSDDVEEPSEETGTPTFGDNELVFMYKKGDEEAGFIIKYSEREDYMNDEKDWLFASKTEAIEKKWANETDFDEL